jgi:hypothetical protein
MLCRTRQDYFDLWEEGKGPGQNYVPPEATEEERKRVAEENEGPGTELRELLRSIDVTKKTGCQCGAKVRQMNGWGVKGCEKKFDEIVQWLRESSSKWDWHEKLSAGCKVLIRHPALARRLNPLDPYPGLVREAIERAKKKLPKETSPTDDIRA